MKQTKKQREPENPKPEVVREYLLKRSRDAVEYLTQENKNLEEWSKKNGDTFLDIIVNYDQIIEQFNAIIRRLETPSDNNDKGLSETNTGKKEGEKIDN